jgi:hypothetical protein
MKNIAALRERFDLHTRAERYAAQGDPDDPFIRK